MFLGKTNLGGWSSSVDGDISIPFAIDLSKLRLKSLFVWQETELLMRTGACCSTVRFMRRHKRMQGGLCYSILSGMQRSWKLLRGVL